MCVHWVSLMQCQQAIHSKTFIIIYLCVCIYILWIHLHIHWCLKHWTEKCSREVKRCLYRNWDESEKVVANNKDSLYVGVCVFCTAFYFNQFAHISVFDIQFGVILSTKHSYHTATSDQKLIQELEITMIFNWSHEGTQSRKSNSITDWQNGSGSR